LYGSTPLEDLIGYNQIVRGMTEWTATGQTATLDQTSIMEGIGGLKTKINANLVSTGPDVFDTSFGLVNVRQACIQGVNPVQAALGAAENFTNGGTNGLVGMKVLPSGVTGNSSTFYVTRRYVWQPAFGLFLQDRLIPIKFMASQLAFEFTFETAAGCIFVAQAGSGDAPTYQVSNVNLLPEILQFDASYGILYS